MKNLRKSEMKTFSALIGLLGLLGISSLAFAEGAPIAPEGPSALIQLLFFGGFILIFYFLMWRPQAKRNKEHKELISGLSKGDEVVTNGGIAGRVTKVTDDFAVIEVSDGVEIKVQKFAVAQTLPKGTLKAI
jgi:preprotein translocase subunit YajC